jgi:hypothetical protein
MKFWLLRIGSCVTVVSWVCRFCGDIILVKLIVVFVMLAMPTSILFYGEECFLTSEALPSEVHLVYLSSS